MISGSSASARSVICHERNSIAAIVIVTLMMLPTTDESVSVNACWASSTSLFNRLTRAPVWVRVKNAIGMRWKCAKTEVRISKMSPSPTRAEIQRCQSESPASARARTPSSTANSTIRFVSFGRIPLSMIAR